MRSQNWAALLTACFTLGPTVAIAGPPGLSEPYRAGPTPQAEGNQAKPEEEAEVTAKQLEKWGQELDSDDFSKREAASRKLLEAGKQSIEVLSKAAQGESNEASSRAMEVLTQLYRKKNKATQAAAEAALKKLASSDRARLSRRAKAALKPAPEKAANPNQTPGLQAQGVLQWNVVPNQQFNVVPNRRLVVVPQAQAQAANEIVETHAQEKNRTIKIRRENKKITVTVTEKIQGKGDEEETEKVTEYKAKDLKELKKKHPEAAKLYKKYGTQVVFQGMRAVGTPTLELKPAEEKK